MQINPIRDKWKGTMTDRQRFNNQMHYKPVDRCFNMEWGFWDENFQTWPIFIDNGITNIGQSNEFFSFDKWKHIVPLLLYPPFEEKVVEERETTNIIRDNLGLLAEVPKDGHGTIPHYLESSIKNPDDWKRCKAERFNRDDPARKPDIEALIKKHPPTRDYPLGIHCGSMIGEIRSMLTLEGLAYAMHDYPDMVEDMVETHCVLAEDFLDRILGKFDFDYATGGEDICFKGGPLVSLDFFRNVLMPRYQRINKRLQAHGIDIWFHDCDGDVRPLIPSWLEVGINCLFPYEVNSCGHPKDVLDEFGKDLRIMGGVDKMVLAAGPGPIKQYLESLVPLVQRGGFIPFCDHRCPPDVKQEYYLYYLDLKEEMFGMK